MSVVAAVRQLDPNSQECKDLAGKINNLVKDINTRDFELSTNPLNLPQSAPPGSPNRASVDGHVLEMKKQIDNLGAAATLYNNKCGGGPPPSPVSAPMSSPSRSFSASMSPATTQQVVKVGVIGIIGAVLIRVAVGVALAF